MATKTCPSCDAEVPTSAARCKECFHDFTEKPRRSSGPLLLLLGTLTLMAVIGAATLGVIFLRPLEERILVDESSQAVIFTTKYRSGAETERIDWSDITSLEHLTTAGGDFQIVAITLDGGRHVIMSSDGRPIRSDAEHYAKLMDKPLHMVDRSGGFGRAEE